MNIEHCLLKINTREKGASMPKDPASVVSLTSAAPPQQTPDQLMACMRLISIGQFTAGVAHELNNPLSVILGFAQSLLSQANDPQTTQQSLETIERETQRCIRIVQDLLNVARLPKKDRSLDDIYAVLEGALALVEAQTRIRRVTLIRRFSENIPQLLLCRQRIQQMIINLCANAIDAMPQGGRLEIEVSQGIDSKRAAVLRIGVHDSGLGIPADVRKRIFEPFFTTKKEGKGTGLGLSLVQEVVEEHEGSIHVSSELGKGTSFVIQIPIRTMPINPARDRPGEL
jgi:signal transduction histidine kinase